MAQLVAFALVSLDGYVNDRDGKIDWHEPDEEVHEFINDLQIRFSDHIYDEGTYQIMKYWENPPDIASMPRVVRQYADLWKKTNKTVISRRLTELDSAHYTVWPELTHEALHSLKQRAPGDIMIGGTELVSRSLSLGQLDRFDLLTVPVLLGGGQTFFRDIPRTGLRLVSSRSFGKGWLYAGYAVT